MKKNELLNLLDLKAGYDKSKHLAPISFAFSDVLLGTENRVFYMFNTSESLKIIMKTTEFSEEIKKVEINLIFENDEVLLDKSETLINEVFLFLNFEKNFDASVIFIANFLTKVLIPKFHMKGNFTAW